MSPHLKCVFTILLVSVATACGGNGSAMFPTAPTATPPPAPRVSPNAVPLGLGETVQRVVTTSDLPYDTGWGPEPCLRFAVMVPTSGTLRAHVTSPQRSSGLTLWVNEKAFWDQNNDITGTGQVRAETTYEVVVSMHDPQIAVQSFELTTSLDRK
jgi:hypothetical protein